MNVRYHFPPSASADGGGSSARERVWFPRGPLAEWANIVLITTNDISHGPEAEQLEKLAGTRGDKLRWELGDVMRPHCLWLVNC